MHGFEFKKNNFDLIRLVAALQVAIFHGNVHFGLGGGDTLMRVLSIFPGVPIFFIVSGYLVSASYERKISVRDYFVNRILRIYPALWVCFLVSLLSIFAIYPVRAGFGEFFLWGLAQISIGQFYNPDFLRGYGVGVLNGSLWTIPVELQFYLILPVIYAILKRLSRRPFSACLAVLFLVFINQVYVAAKASHDDIYVKLFGVTIAPYIYMFLFGVILQRNRSFVRKFLANKAAFWLAVYVSLAALFSSFGLSFGGNNLNPVSAFFLAIFVISFAYSYVDLLRGFSGGVDVSYGIYIYHMIVVNCLIRQAWFSPFSNFLLMFLITLILACLSWFFVEKPSLGLKRYSIKRS
ncbi:acyltransferase family protein [Litorivivens sp.]|uniref:acyltransferase family protein n=1 Tax=Litorivivens sp. TaxID=2020868 RepID=UPI0035684933